VSYGAREPGTAMERAQERTEDLYADETRWLQREIAAERMKEVPSEDHPTRDTTDPRG
jgi:hypothetical protein